MEKEETCFKTTCFNKSMLAAGLTGLLIGKIKYGGMSNVELAWTIKEVVKLHESYPISSSKSIIEELNEILKKLNNETATMGVRNSVESVTSKGLEQTDREA